MQAGGSQTRSVQFLTAAVSPETGPGGIGVVALNVCPTEPAGVYEQAIGTSEELLYTAVLRALQLGKRLGASEVTVFCPDEMVVKQINRELRIVTGGRLALLYIKVKALMYRFESARVVTASRSKVSAARKLALAASRIPVPKKESPRTLFTTV